MQKNGISSAEIAMPCCRLLCWTTG